MYATNACQPPPIATPANYDTFMHQYNDESARMPLYLHQYGTGFSIPV